MIDTHHRWNTSFTPVIFGFFLSFCLLVTAYFIAVRHVLHHWPMLLTVMGLACVQAIAQLVLFLHVGLEAKPRWYALAFLFMLAILLTIIGGSLWIMYSLNYTMMPTMH